MDWKEKPIDCLLLALRFLQQYYLKEILRGKAGVGNYTLTNPELRIEVEEIGNFDVVPYEHIISSIKDGNYVLPAHDNSQLSSSNTILSKAYEIIRLQKVHLVAQAQCFTVQSNNAFNNVTIDPPKPKCTCPSPRLCSHIVAVFPL